MRNEKTKSKKRPWEPMRLSYVGKLTELVQGGGGKSGVGSDSGDLFKPRGGGG